MNLVKEWQNVLMLLLRDPNFKMLERFLENERKIKIIYPSEDQVYRAFNLCPPSKVKVVIIGQDPYHTEGAANGLSFSVNDGIGFPPSLINIFKELKADIGINEPVSGDLKAWAKQGVLLLNSVLTVEQGRPKSHFGKGWEEFTDYVIKKLNNFEKPIVFMLWGKDALQKEALITNTKHCIIKSTHPSPFSAINSTRYLEAFFGSKPFSRANAYLKKWKLKPIDWKLES